MKQSKRPYTKRHPRWNKSTQTLSIAPTWSGIMPVLLKILEDPKPVRCHDIVDWGRWFESNPEARRVNSTAIDSKVHVSTVFLGLDHNFYGDTDPILFETLVFGGSMDGEMDRCATWEQALK